MLMCKPGEIFIEGRFPQEPSMNLQNEDFTTEMSGVSGGIVIRLDNSKALDFWLQVTIDKALVQACITEALEKEAGKKED